MLTAQHLNIGYKDEVIARDISLQLLQGQFMAVVGINGIGKSTLLRTLVRLQPALGGNILLQGKPLEQYSAKALATQLAVVLTEPLASGNLSVWELVAQGRHPHTNWMGTLASHDIEKIHSALSQLALDTLAHRKCHELSDGQLQRAHLARALAQDAPLILLDEPTAHLDMAHKVQLFKLLLHMAHNLGKTIVCATHEVEMALQLCDLLLVLNGQDNPMGTPQELIASKVFERLFSQDDLSFDAAARTFTIKK